MTPRIFAIRYAHKPGGRRAENFYGGDPHDAPMPMAYYVWAIDLGGRWIVVDTGFGEGARARRPGREFVCDPLEVLRALGAEPGAVEDVILTHLHWDHAGGLAGFPRASFWLQDRELAFWTGRYAARPSIAKSVEVEDVVALVRLNFDRRLRFVDGEATVAPGVTLHRVGGHAPGLQVVRVETGAGAVLLASDATHYYANVEEDRPFSTVSSLPDMYAAFDRLRELGGVLVPGHDPLVLERYPAASPDLAGFAVEIRPAS